MTQNDSSLAAQHDAGLKAERIQFTGPELAGVPFTLDRIKVLLRDLPGWAVMRTNRGIFRRFVFGSADAALTYATLATKIAAAAQHRVRLDLQEKCVFCILAGQNGNAITIADYNLALHLSLQG